MRKCKKVIMSLLLAASLVVCSGQPVNAATSGAWNIDYHPGPTTGVGNQISNVTLDYYSGGYVADCATISGTNGRALTISSTDAGGMSSIRITITGPTRDWRMNGSTTNKVMFSVVAVSGYRCQSTGTIRIYN